MSRWPRVAVVDHHDSFTWNLVHALERAGARCAVQVHDQVASTELRSYDGVVLSAGPCSPREAATSVAFVREVAALGGPPILGICLGHQCIAAALGGKVARSGRPLHGRAVAVHHDGRSLFAGCESPLELARYNSLTVTDLPECLERSAWDAEGSVMGLRHRTRPIEGVQVHPESHLSPRGARLFENWVSTLGHGSGLPARTG